MKSLLRRYIITLFSLWAVDYAIPGLTITADIPRYLMAAGLFMGLDIFIRPILKIVFLPINIITLGLSGFLIHAILLYALTYFIPDISVQPWEFAGVSYGTYSLPKISFGIIPTYIISSAYLSMLIGFLRWL